MRDFRDGAGHWDYAAGLEIACSFGWRPSEIFEQAGLTSLLDSSRVAVILSTGNTLQTGRRFVATDLPIADLNSDPTELRLALTSAQLCGRLNATLVIYCNGGSIDGLQIRRGSILYREEASLPLEGDLASFPVRAISFSESGLGEGLWLVDVSAESPTDPVLATVTLLLNSDRADFISRLRSGEDQLLRWIIRADVIATVLTSCLLNEELGYDNLEEYPEGSLGAVVGTWLRGLGVEGLAACMRFREEVRREPGLLRQRCQKLSAALKEPS
jgi:hypothetical protein